MKQLKNMQIIGIDNGYGNLKTTSGIFPASVLTFDHKPVHAQDLLVYDGKYHIIGSGTGSSHRTRSATRITTSLRSPASDRSCGRTG